MANKKAAKRPLGNFLIQFEKDMSIAKKGQKYFVNEEQANLLTSPQGEKKIVKAKLVKEYSDKEMDSLVQKGEWKSLLTETKASK